MSVTEKPPGDESKSKKAASDFATNVAELNKQLTPLVDIIKSLASLIGPVSVVVGPVLLIAYITKISSLWNNVPISSAEMFSSAFVPVVFFSSAFIFFSLAAPIVFLSIFVRPQLAPQLIRIFPMMRTQLVNRSDSDAETVSGDGSIMRRVGVWLLDYLFLNAPTLIVVVLFFILPGYFVLAATAFCVGLMMIFLCLLIVAPRGEWGAIASVFILNAVNVIFMIYSVAGMSTLYNGVYGDPGKVVDGGNVGVYYGLLVYFYVDFVFLIRKISLTKAIPLTVALFALLLSFTFGGAVLGALSLRLLGLGGGLPASLLVKNSGQDGNTSSPIAVRGCIVLNLGGQIVVEEFRPGAAAKDGCAIREWASLQNGDDRLGKFCRISVYARSEIMQTSKIDVNWEGHSVHSTTGTNCSS